MKKPPLFKVVFSFINIWLMYQILIAGRDNIKDIKEVASVAWPDAFMDILSAGQIVYMMEMMYSNAAIEKQMEDGHKYFLTWDGDLPIAYMAIEHNYDNMQKTKVHKAYVLPEYRSKGIGRLLFNLAENVAKENGDNTVCLNVNKYNTSAIAFYNKSGFELTKEEIIDIGNGFVMDDYVFEKKIR